MEEGNLSKVYNLRFSKDISMSNDLDQANFELPNLNGRTRKSSSNNLLSLSRALNKDNLNNGYSLMAIKSGDFNPNLTLQKSKADDLVNWLGTDLEHNPKMFKYSKMSFANSNDLKHSSKLNSPLKPAVVRNSSKNLKSSQNLKSKGLKKIKFSEESKHEQKQNKPEIQAPKPKKRSRLNLSPQA